jgi:hypothetical protein
MVHPKSKTIFIAPTFFFVNNVLDILFSFLFHLKVRFSLFVSVSPAGGLLGGALNS